jgi:hypothetical protein
MEDFAEELVNFPKWHDKEFTKEQLKKHLLECSELLDNEDEHFNAELIDLIQIAKVYFSQTMSSDELDNLYHKRWDKFMQKLALDKK